MTKEQAALTVITLILTPLCVSVFRRLRSIEERQAKADEFTDFLKTYLLRDAVLKFHSPDPQHAQTDRVIEKLVEGKELQPNELEKLVDRIKLEALSASDKKRRLEATTTLALMEEFIHGIVSGGDTALSEIE